MTTPSHDRATSTTDDGAALQLSSSGSHRHDTNSPNPPVVKCPVAIAPVPEPLLAPQMSRSPLPLRLTPGSTPPLGAHAQPLIPQEQQQHQQGPASADAPQQLDAEQQAQQLQHPHSPQCQQGHQPAAGAGAGAGGGVCVLGGEDTGAPTELHTPGSASASASAVEALSSEVGRGWWAGEHACVSWLRPMHCDEKICVQPGSPLCTG
jgi:hypothetical protein